MNEGMLGKGIAVLIAAAVVLSLLFGFVVEALTLLLCGQRPGPVNLFSGLWLAVTGVATLLGFVSMGGLGFLAIVGVVAAGVYLADVRPAVETVQGRGTGSHQGPYGPW